VNEKVLRFDFSHFSKMTDEELRTVERMVNARIRENIRLEERTDVPFDEAREMGAMALFGEKYGDTVRVISFDPQYSVELCGGTHVPATGQIGSFRIVSEGSIAAGIRRIEAVTAEGADAYVEEQLDTLKAVRGALRDPDDVVAQIEGIVEQRSKLEKELQRTFLKQAEQLKDTLLASAENVDGLSRIVGKVDLPDAAALKKLAFDLEAALDRLFLVLAADVGGKPQIVVLISKDLVGERSLDAAAIVRELAKEIRGGGGGKPFYAQAGGKDVGGLDRVVDRAKSLP
jgi:alanyl-tRNA synthetase